MGRGRGEFRRTYSQATASCLHETVLKNWPQFFPLNKSVLYHLLHNITSVCPGPVKHATFTEFFAKTFRNLQHPNLLQDRFASWVVKWASSFCSNVVKQVALFYVRFSIALGY